MRLSTSLPCRVQRCCSRALVRWEVLRGKACAWKKVCHWFCLSQMTLSARQQFTSTGQERIQLVARASGLPALTVAWCEVQRTKGEVPVSVACSFDRLGCRSRVCDHLGHRSRRWADRTKTHEFIPGWPNQTLAEPRKRRNTKPCSRARRKTSPNKQDKL